MKKAAQNLVSPVKGARRILAGDDYGCNFSFLKRDVVRNDEQKATAKNCVAENKESSQKRMA